MPGIIKSLCRQNAGYAFIAVLVVLSFVAILATASVSISVTNLKQRNSHSDEYQAHALALSGAEVAIRNIRHDPAAILASPQALSFDLEAGHVAVAFQETAGQRVEITSTATSNGVGGDDLAMTDTVRVLMTRTTSSDLFRGIRTLAPTRLDLGNLLIAHEAGDHVRIEQPNADIELSTKNEGGGGDGIRDASDPLIVRAKNDEGVAPIVYPSVSEPPEGLTKTGSSYIVTNTATRYFDEIDVAQNETLELRTDDREMTVVVKNGFHVKGPSGGASGSNIVIAGTGIVRLYLLEGGIVETPVQVATTGAGTGFVQLYLYVAVGKTLTLNANAEIAAYVYAPGATVEMNGNGILQGALVAETFRKMSTGGGGGASGAPNGEFHFVPPLDDTTIDPSVYRYEVRHYQ